MIPVFELIRLEENYQYGTFGVFRINKKVFCVTLEPRDEENEKRISSIPVQQYICKRILSPTFGETFEVLNVPGRSNVLFHPGNKVEDTEGCILMASKFGKLAGDRAVLNSGNTFKLFMTMMKSVNTASLTIYERY